MDYNCLEAEEIIEELLHDNSMEERRLQLFNQLYGEGSSSTPRRVINRDRVTCVRPRRVINDINVLDRSPVFDEVLQGRALEINYKVNGNDYNMGYYLTDGIYPEWVTFVKTIPRPLGDKRRLFSKYQEGQRKDVERAFGVLQSRFAIIRGLARFWDKEDLSKIMRACILLHNMIVEDERHTYVTLFGPLPTYDDAINGPSQPNLEEEPFLPYESYIQNNVRLRDRQKHRQLLADLIEHISQFHNNH